MATLPALKAQNPFGIGVSPTFDPSFDLTPEQRRALLRDLARDLLELHIETGISLDKWVSARTFVEAFYGPVADNGA